MVTISLDKWTYEVDAGTAPMAALDRFRKNASAYSLILTNIKMPGISGEELARCVKEIRPDIKVMNMTPFELKDLRETLPSIESQGLLQKAFHTADVCVAVRRHLTAV